MFDAILADFRKWFSQPFSTTMSGSGWIYFIGFLLVVIFLWSRVLSHLKEAGEAI